MLREARSVTVMLKAGKPPVKPVPVKKPQDPDSAAGASPDTQAVNNLQVAKDSSGQLPPPPPSQTPQNGDQDNPEAPTPEEFEAAGQGKNTEDPNEDAVDSGNTDNTIEDTVGQEDHSQKSDGTDEIHGARDDLNAYLQVAGPSTRDSVSQAIRHLSDSTRQGNFGQWQGAAASAAHAVVVLNSARDAADNDQDRGAIQKLADAVNAAGAVLLKNNNSGDLPLPVKRFRLVQVKYSEDQARDDHGRFGSGGSERHRQADASMAQGVADLAASRQAADEESDKYHSEALEHIQADKDDFDKRYQEAVQGAPTSGSLGQYIPLMSPPNGSGIRAALGRGVHTLTEHFNHSGDKSVVASVQLKYFDDQPRDDHGRFGSGSAGGGGEQDGPGEERLAAHGVGVSTDPNSQSLHSLTGPQRPDESEKDYNQRLFDHGQEHYTNFKDLSAHAAAYRAKLGLPEPKVDDWTKIQADMGRAHIVGDAFAAAKSDPKDPEVRAAYADLVKQAGDQWHVLTDPVSKGGMGVKVDFVSPDDIRRDYGDKEGLNPYPTAEAQEKDLEENHHLAIASIHDYPEAYHPLLNNDRGGEYDKFRAVHDAFGHAAIGADFTRHGEYQAWLHHSSMFTGGARRAASTELTGENSYLFTRHDAAPHKAALLDDKLTALPWDKDGNLLDKPWKDTKAARSGKRPHRGGEHEVFAKFGVVNPQSALLGKIARERANAPKFVAHWKGVGVINL